MEDSDLVLPSEAKNNFELHLSTLKDFCTILHALKDLVEYIRIRVTSKSFTIHEMLPENQVSIFIQLDSEVFAYFKTSGTQIIALQTRALCTALKTAQKEDVVRLIFKAKRPQYLNIQVQSSKHDEVRSYDLHTYPYNPVFVGSMDHTFTSPMSFPADTLRGVVKTLSSTDGMGEDFVKIYRSDACVSFQVDQGVYSVSMARIKIFEGSFVEEAKAKNMNLSEMEKQHTAELVSCFRRCWIKRVEKLFGGDSKVTVTMYLSSGYPIIFALPITMDGVLKIAIMPEMIVEDY